MRNMRIRGAALFLCMAVLCAQAGAAAPAVAEPECSSVDCVTTAEDLAEFYAPDADSLNDALPAGQAQESTVLAEPTVEVIYEGNEYENVTDGDALSPAIARDTGKPTAFWNLSSKGRYLATFSGVSSTTTLYTNYYFDFAPFTHTSGELEGVKDGRIYLKYNIYTWDQSKQACKWKLTLYCKDCEKELSTHTSKTAGARDTSSGPVTTIVSFTSGSAHKDHFCYFKIQNATQNGSMYGSAKIGHSTGDVN